MVIPFEFSTNYGCEFSEGIAEVKKGDLYGFIDSTGKVIVPVKYKTSYDYNGFDNGVGMLIDSETDKRFYFDKAGTLFFED